MIKWLKNLFKSKEVQRLDKEIEHVQHSLETVRKYHAWSQIKIDEEVLRELKYIKTGKRFPEV